MLNIEMLRMQNIYDDICTEHDMNENSDIDNSTDGNTVNVELANQHSRTHSVGSHCETYGEISPSRTHSFSLHCTV